MPSKPTGLANIDAEIAFFLADPATSSWLKSALKSAIERDPCDCSNDAEVLMRLLLARCSAILGGAVPSTYGAEIRQSTCVIRTFIDLLINHGGDAALMAKFLSVASCEVRRLDLIADELADHPRAAGVVPCIVPTPEDKGPTGA